MNQTIITPDDVLVRTQETPNPYALKFIVNHSLANEDKITLAAKEECPGVKLAEDLFDIAGVKQLYFFENTLTVTHDGSLENSIIRDNVRAILKTRIPIHDSGFAAKLKPQEVKKQSVDRSQLSPERQQIEEILDRTIRPGLQADGGDLEVISYESNMVKILYQGACGGCPSSMMGTLDAIQGILREEMGNPELRVAPI